MESWENWSGSGWTRGREMVRSMVREFRSEVLKAWQLRGWSVPTGGKDWECRLNHMEKTAQGQGTDWLCREVKKRKNEK